MYFFVSSFTEFTLNRYRQPLVEQRLVEQRLIKSLTLPASYSSLIPYNLAKDNRQDGECSEVQSQYDSSDGPGNHNNVNNTEVR